MARIVVTGGGGFLGQRLIGALLESDRLVINGDHVSIGSLCVIDRVIPEHFRARGIETIEGDLLSIIRSRHEIFEGVDAVIHLASAVSGECEADLELGLEVNVNAGMALGRRLAQEKNKPFLYFPAHSLFMVERPSFHCLRLLLTIFVRIRKTATALRNLYSRRYTLTWHVAV